MYKKPKIAIASGMTPIQPRKFWPVGAKPRGIAPAIGAMRIAKHTERSIIPTLADISNPAIEECFLTENRWPTL
ncbi:hypothetical protein ACF1BQ_004295 [Bradyrhizobium sp. RDT10]